MTIKLIATAATAALIASTAIAGEIKKSTDMGVNDARTSIFDTQSVEKTFKTTNGFFEPSENLILASTLIGKSVYNGVNEEAEAIGDVNNVLMGPDGQAKAVIIGVGGFLGIGEKDVALDFDKISWVSNDGDKKLIVETTKLELEAAPEFEMEAAS